jgi:hypothetical protein
MQASGLVWEFVGGCVSVFQCSNVMSEEVYFNNPFYLQQSQSQSSMKVGKGDFRGRSRMYKWIDDRRSN